MSVASTNETEDFHVSYTAKDAILYALSVGFGSSKDHYEKDLKYTYEKHGEFATVPTFYLSLIFLAERTKNIIHPYGIPPFPPPMMSYIGVLPRRFLKDPKESITEYPVLHTHQRIAWMSTTDSLPVPRKASVRLVLRGRIKSVVPKEIGTFVTTETTIWEDAVSPQRRRLLCSIQSTALVLGIPKELIRSSLDEDTTLALSRPIRRHADKKLLFQSNCKILHDRALLFRLASGDTNEIHVERGAVPFFDSDRPLLHGLCTLGIVMRIILQNVVELHDGKDFVLTELEAKFAKPLLIGDVITLHVWKLVAPTTKYGAIELLFEARNKDSGDLVLSNGRTTAVRRGSLEQKTMSRL